MSVEENRKNHKKSKKHRKSKFISFEEEIVTRDKAEKLLSEGAKTFKKEIENNETKTNFRDVENNETSAKIKKKKNKKSIEGGFAETCVEAKDDNQNFENGSEKGGQKKKKSKGIVEIENGNEENNINEMQIQSEVTTKKKKRKKKNEVSCDSNNIAAKTEEEITESKPKKHRKHEVEISNETSLENEETNAGTDTKDYNQSCENGSQIGSQKKKKKNKLKRIVQIENGNEENNIDDMRIQSETKKKKRKKENEVSCDSNNIVAKTEEGITESKPKKRRKHEVEKSNEASLDNEETNAGTDTQAASVKPAKPKSIRQQKRNKHQKLLEENKAKMEKALKEKALNYLSRWKHSRRSWKFEKLRQIWLQQNLFDSTKVPSEFWDTVLEYFAGAKGRAKTILTEKAVKIIEENKSQSEGDSEEKTESQEAVEQDSDDGKFVKLKRARELMQYLQDE